MKRFPVSKNLIAVLVMAFAAIVAAPARGAGPGAEAVTEGTLDIGKCVEIGLKKHPSITGAQSSAAAANSRIYQARSAYYPNMDINAGYTRTDGPSSNIVSRYSSGVSLSQNIYDFGRTSSLVKERDFSFESARATVEDTKNRVALDVKKAYYAVLLARKDRDVQKDTVKQFEKHLEQAEGFFEVGTKPKFDVTRAQVALSNARVGLIKAENALKIAWANLKVAMGVPEAPDFEIKDNLAFSEYRVTLDEAVSRALLRRPDLRSAVEKERSARAGVDLAQSDYYPTLSGSAGYNFSGDSFPLEKGWNVGAVVTLPIFSGFLTKYQVSESRANLGSAEADKDLIRQSAVFEVQQAFLNLKDAEERVPASELAVKQAAENLDLAEARYATGVGNPIELTDATVEYSNARLVYFQALADYRTAVASLENAMGER